MRKTRAMGVGTGPAGGFTQQPVYGGAKKLPKTLKPPTVPKPKGAK